MHGKIRQLNFDSSNIGINKDANMNHNTNVRIGNLKTNIKQLDKKDSLLSYTFDHIYACNEGNAKNNTENTHMNSDHCELNNAIENKERSAAFSQLNDNINNTISEVRYLKDLLLLHLDLIQQQSEQLLTKDKLISSLRQENDLLKSKLGRSDRRIYSKRSNLNGTSARCQSPEVLQNQNSSAEPLLTNGCCSAQDSVENSLSVITEINSNSSPLNINNQISTDKSKSKFNKVKLVKSNGVCSSPESSVIGENGGNVINKIILHKINTDYELTLNNGLKRDANEDNTNSRKEISQKHNEDLLSSNIIKTVCEGEEMSIDVNVKGKKRALEDISSTGNFSTDHLTDHETKRRNREFMMTNSEYHIAIGDIEFGLEDNDDVNINDQTSILEVPRWCGQVYSSSTSIEGIENLDDNIIAKRHLKWEIEEKRRKRWDVQRIREQRNIERLKSRQSRSSNARVSISGAMSGSTISGSSTVGSRLSPSRDDDTSSHSPRSLWPHPHHARFIVLTEQLPVCALGANLPVLQPREFSLPWSTQPSAKSPSAATSRRTSQTIDGRRRQRRQRVKSCTKPLV